MPMYKVALRVGRLVHVDADRFVWTADTVELVRVDSKHAEVTVAIFPREHVVYVVSNDCIYMEEDWDPPRQGR